MENQTIVYMFILTGLSDLPSLQLPLFLLFFLIYIMTLIGNLLICLLIFTDSHLQTPMYFFLGTLACLDTGYSTVTTPRMLFNMLTEKKEIFVEACITQVYFFFFFTMSEAFVLAVMSYDRYIAICHPLHYMQRMSWKICVHLVSGVFIFSVVNSLVHTFFLTKLNFCRPDALQSFFCDLPQLLQVSCTDTFINELLIFFSGIMFGVVILVVTFYPYITIIRTVLKLQTKNMMSKAFSTCSAHLTVVIIFYGSIFFNYLRPNAKYRLTEDKVSSVFYATLTPFLNPLIYSLRNQELRIALRRSLRRL